MVSQKPKRNPGKRRRKSKPARPKRETLRCDLPPRRRRKVEKEAPLSDADYSDGKSSD